MTGGTTTRDAPVTGSTSETGTYAPMMTVTYIMTTATIESGSADIFFRYMAWPRAMATGISHQIGITECGYFANIVAMTRQKIAITMRRASETSPRNMNRTRGDMRSRARSPIERPLFRIDTTSAAKSCTAPIRIEPRITHMSAGSQPHMMPMAGPTMGPVPAIEV